MLSIAVPSSSCEEAELLVLSNPTWNAVSHVRYTSHVMFLSGVDWGISRKVKSDFVGWRSGGFKEKLFRRLHVARGVCHQPCQSLVHFSFGRSTDLKQRTQV